MKRISIFSISFFYLLIHSNPILAQREFRLPLSDAIEFNNPISNNKSEILSAYFENNSLLGSNRFIDASGLSIDSNTKPAKISSIQNSDGNPLGTPMIDALGTVIASRFREELTLAFLESFREKIKAEQYLGALFPNSKLILLNDDPFNHKVWLTSFRGALDEDLKTLPDNLPVLMQEINDRSCIDSTQKYILTTLIDAYTPALEFSRNPEKSYKSIIEFLEKISGRNWENENLSAGLTLSYLLIRELGNSKYDDWAKPNALGELTDPIVLKTYIGFTIEKYATLLGSKNITINGSVKQKFYDYLKSSPDSSINKYISYLNAIVGQVTSITQTITSLNARGKINKLKYEDYIPLINKGLETIDLITGKTALEIIDSAAKLNVDFLNAIKSTNSSVKFIIKINSNIGTKDYSKIIVNTLSFITEFVDHETMNKSSELKEFIKYSDLAVNLAGATTSKEMADAIEGAALPTQSYRLKRNSYFSITLNSYAGVFIAREYLINKDAKNKISGITGFTAPIGLALNWGIGKGDNPTRFSKYPTKTVINAKGKVENKNYYFTGHSLSLFASIVDVGAISTFRLTDDQTPITNIQWQNIFAPGAYLVWGIGNTPLSLSLGGQYGPELRTVTAKDGISSATIDSRAWRFGISLTVDIPLFSFYAKSEKVIK